MNRLSTVRPHRLVLVVAALAAVLAFVCSYALTPTYEASTRLIIHGRDASFLSSSGQSQSSQPSLTDPSQAQALADTYGSIATSRAVASAVVDQLHLDKQSGSGGVLHVLGSAAAWVYRCGRAFVTSGFCASGDPRETAIADVQGGTTAQQLGSTAGSTAGQPGSYVLEVTASGDSGAQAQAITNAVADQLVAASSDQVRKSVQAYITRLQDQLDSARKDVEARSQAVTAFETQHNVSAADQEAAATATAYDNLKADLSTAQADLADSQAQLSSINASLAKTTSTASSDQRISTGRSDTSVRTSQANPVYNDLLSQKSQTEAKITGLQARVTALQQQVSSGSPSAMSGTLADLVDLQDDLTAAQKARDNLSASLADARTQAATAAADLSRLDSAGRPAYPTSPKRYLYLLIGLVLGGLAAGGLAWLSRRRAAGPPDEPVEELDDGLEDELLGEGLAIPSQLIGVVPRAGDALDGAGTPLNGDRVTASGGPVGTADDAD